ncbi:MAG: hypothetical protein E7660_05395 [Ruminococcaceae bacterium]|nr:hypothetical protein [Oscillospiraceae bacterium]
MKTFGIDVSKWQRGFDFKRAADEGVRFAIIKASESSFSDPEFEKHYKNARSAGLLTGAYHYLTATSKEQAVRDAEYLIKNCLAGKTFEFPFFADAEDEILKALPKKTVDEIIKAFCDTLEKAGYWAGFYCNFDFYKNNCSGEELAKRYSLWLASWTKEPLADCQLWQFGGETNLIRGNKVAGVVCDQNYSFRDFPSLIRVKGLNGTKEEIKAASIKVGDVVKLKSGAKVYGTDKTFAPWVYNAKLFVREINGDRVVVSTQKTGAVTGAVDINDLQ